MNANRTSLAREGLVIAVLTLLGAVPRFWNFGRLSLTHFDEGIYAFSGLWITGNDGSLGLDPMVIAYAPPGFPILVGLAYLAFGISDYSAILVATVCGIATIPVVGWLGRRTFGPGAGSAASTFAAMSMAHVAFSRKALTDAPFLLAWVVAIGLGGRFLEKPGLARALALGLVVGIAQNLKYNGWLAGVLVIIAAVSGAIKHGDGRRPGALLRTFGWGLAAAIVAALVYAPWFGFVESHGGYAALLRHHRSYLGGASAWWSNWNTQLGEAYALSGTRRWGAIVWSLAWLACGWTAIGPRLVPSWTRRRSVGFVIGLGFGAALFAFQANIPWWVGLGWSPWLLLSATPTLRLLGSWWLLLSILTPLYHPYARLWLPLHAVGWLFLGGLIARFGSSRPDFAEDSASRSEIHAGRRQRLVAATVALACVLFATIQVVRERPRSISWDRVLAPSDSASLRSFVFVRIPREPRLEGKTLRVLARRPLAFYLSVQGRHPFQLEPGLDRLSHVSQPDAMALIDEALLAQEGNTSEALARLLPYWRTEWSSTIEVDPVTLLDLNPSAFRSVPRRDLVVWVMSPRITPGEPTDLGSDPSPKKTHDEP
jgi:dolichyl-phosphate-mannose-protein mannosyltransferase